MQPYVLPSESHALPLSQNRFIVDKTICKERHVIVKYIKII